MHGWASGIFGIIVTMPSLMCVSSIWQVTVVEEDQTGVLTDVSAVAGDRLVLRYERDAYVQVHMYILSFAYEVDSFVMVNFLVMHCCK